MKRRFLVAAVLMSAVAIGGIAHAQSQVADSVKIGMRHLGYESSVIDSVTPEQAAEIENVLNTGMDDENNTMEKKSQIDTILGE
jgi:hypothetical protein